MRWNAPRPLRPWNAPRPPRPRDRGLAREAIGLREVFFQSVTHMAPAAAVDFSIIVGANFASGAPPLSVVFAFVRCLLVAISIGQLAKHLPSAGALLHVHGSRIHRRSGSWWLGLRVRRAARRPGLYLGGNSFKHLARAQQV